MCTTSSSNPTQQMVTLKQEPLTTDISYQEF